MIERVREKCELQKFVADLDTFLPRMKRTTKCFSGKRIRYLQSIFEEQRKDRLVDCNNLSTLETANLTTLIDKLHQGVTFLY